MSSPRCCGIQQPRLHLARFRGVDNAEEIRDVVGDRMRYARAAGLGDPDDAADENPPHSDEDVLTAALEELKQSSAAVRDAARRLAR
jgi:hypothetical protein